MNIDSVSSQIPLPFSQRICKTCPYHAEARCRGWSVHGRSGSMFTAEPTCPSSDRQWSLHADLRSEAFGPALPCSQRGLHLPGFIPGVGDFSLDVSLASSFGLYAISLTTLVDKHGRMRYSSRKALLNRLHLPETVGLGLIGTIPDTRLEKLWRRSDSDPIWELIREMRFQFATSFSFSVWESSSPYTQLFNQDRNFYTYERLNALGIPTIPFVFTSIEAPELNLDYCAQWLRDRPDIGHIALLTQCIRQDAFLTKVIHRMLRLEAMCGRQLSYVAVGPSTPARLELLASCLKRVSFVSSHPLVAASKGMLLDGQLRQQAAPHLSRNEVAVANLNHMARFTSGLTSRETATSINVDFPHA